MINLKDLPDNTAELIHEALDKAISEPASDPQEEAEPSGGSSENASALCGKLLSAQRRMQSEIDALRTELAAETKKTAFLQSELDEVRSLYVNTALADEPPSTQTENRCLHTIGVAALLTPLLFGGGALVSLALQHWAGSWGVVGSILLTFIVCIILGLLLLLLEKRGGGPSQALLDWLADDDWPEGPREDFIGKERAQMNAPAYTELLKQLDALHGEMFRDIEISDPRVSLIYRTAAVMEQLRAYAAKVECHMPKQEGRCG